MKFTMEGTTVVLPLGRMERMVVRQLYRKNRHYPERRYLPELAPRSSTYFGTNAAREHVADVLIAMTASRVSERMEADKAMREAMANALGGMVVELTEDEFVDMFGRQNLDFVKDQHPDAFHGDYRDMRARGDNPNGYL